MGSRGLTGRVCDAVLGFASVAVADYFSEVVYANLVVCFRGAIISQVDPRFGVFG